MLPLIERGCLCLRVWREEYIEGVENGPWLCPLTTPGSCQEHKEGTPQAAEPGAWTGQEVTVAEEAVGRGRADRGSDSQRGSLTHCEHHPGTARQAGIFRGKNQGGGLFGEIL